MRVISLLATVAKRVAYCSLLLLGLLSIHSSIPSTAHASCVTGGGLCASDGHFGTKINISWNDSQNYFQYFLHRATGIVTCRPNQPGCSGWTQIYQTYNEAATYQDTEISSSQMYSYWLCYSVTSGGSEICPETGPAGLRRVTGWRAPPPTPTLLNTTDGTNTSNVGVTWSSVTNFSPSTFTLYRATNSHSCESGGSTLMSGLTSNSLNDSSATPGVTYYYSLKRVASNGGGNSACLTEGGGGWRKMLPPTNVTAAATAPIAVTVNWNHPSASGAPSNGVVSYRVYRRAGSSSSVCTSGQQVGTVPGSSPVFQDGPSTGLLPTVNYYYAVRSEGLNGTLSDCSTASSASATPPGYSISGTVTKDIGGGLQGATVSIGSASTTTAASGAYTFSGLAPGSFTVTASKSGVSITPSNVPVFIQSTSATGVNFIASCASGFQFNGSSCVAITYRLGGTIRDNTGAPIPSVSISGGALGTRTTNSSGYYEYASVAHGTSYSLIPTLSGFTFSPSNQSGTLFSITLNVDFTGILLPPNPPTNVSATDGNSTGSVSVSWNAPSGPAASSYNVFRDGNQVGNVGASSFSDTSATPGVTYQYSVNASNSGGTSGQSASDAGYRALSQTLGLVTTAPTTSSISVSWSATPHASLYHLWTNGTCSGSANQIVSGTSHLFSGLAYGSYTYSVKGVGANNQLASGTPCSAPTQIELIPEAPGSPLGLSASDGTFTDKVLVTWTLASGTVTEYQIFRQADCTGTPIGTSNGSSFEDLSATRGVISTYSARAFNASTPGPCSNNDTGFAALIAPGVVSNLSASDGTSTSLVQVTWDTPSSGDAPSSYEIYRDNATCSGTPLQTTDAGTLSLQDSNTVAGVSYQYRVKAINAGGSGPCSSLDEGFRAMPAVTGVTATAQPQNSALVSWTALAGATEYHVFRSADCSGAPSSSTTSSLLVSPLALDVTHSFSLRAAGANGLFSNATPCSNVATVLLASSSLTVQASSSLGEAMQNVEVFTNGSSRGFTNAAGLLQITGLGANDYVVTAARANTSFTPTQHQLSLQYGESASRSFEASCSPGFQFNNGLCEPIPAQAIEVSLGCVYELGNGAFRAYFGYSNDNGEVTIPVGDVGVSRNFFSPGTLGQGQVTQFLSGSQPGAFSVEFDGTDLTWNVEYQGKGLRSVTANSESPRCLPITPEAKCISINSIGQIVARFGYTNPNGFVSPLIIPVGPNNRFSPAPENRGQTTHFLNGMIASAFETALEPTSLAWTVDGVTATATLATEVCAPGNLAPTANAGGPYSGICQGSLTNVQLSALASQDPDGNPLRYNWSTNCAQASFNNPQAAQPVLTLLQPGLGQAQSCSVTVQVSDGLLLDQSSTSVNIGACALDCLMNPNGGATVDICGVCGGDGTSCRDCAGAPFGMQSIDLCGVCGGTNACLDCTGTPNGMAGPDRCGVCGGDGTSCLGCVETNLSDLLTLLTRDFFTLRDLNARSLRHLGKVAAPINRKITRRLVPRELKKIDFRYNQIQLELYAELPPTVVSCTNSALCVQKDNAPVLERYGAQADEFLASTEQTMKRLKRLIGSLTGRDKKRLRRAKMVRATLRENLNAVPRIVSSCE